MQLVGLVPGQLQTLGLQALQAHLHPDDVVQQEVEVLVGAGTLMLVDLFFLNRHVAADNMIPAGCPEFAAKLDMIHILFSGDFFLCTTLADHWIFGANLVMCLNIFEMEGFLAVLAVEGPFWALPFIMTLLVTEANAFLARGTGDDHELTLPLVT